MDFAAVRDLFTRALQLAPAERSAFLERECAGDDELRAEVESLLATHREDDDLLEPPSRDALEALLGASVPRLERGARLGPFRLERVIASGGMGIVYEATRENPRRRVALKVMRLGLAGESSARRFRHEAEILAGLRHPSIATMFETGVRAEGGREVPWFAMELVEDARSIVRYAEEEELALEQRLHLFVQVCDAVHHGHMRGVIHRDLKPDNILVDGSGRPRVIDFGVARATGADLALSTLQTQAGAIVGTLATMSPEQVGGDRENVDLRTDVYSLGVVLYRLLAGRMPHELAGVSLPEAARAIREDAPTRPGALDVRLRGDLETILSKALEKERARRYSSAAALGEDVERYLAGEPIQARPPSLSYQARLFARRHRALTVAAALVVVVSLAAAAVSLRFGLRAQDSSERSARSLGIVRDVGRELLYDVLDEMEGLAGGTEARASVAATATRYLDALEREAEDDASLLRDLAAGYRRLARFQGDPDEASLGAVGAAARSYERAVDLADRVVELEPDDEATRLDAQRIRLELGSQYVRLGRAGDAEARFRGVLAEAERRGAVDLAGDAHSFLGNLAAARGDDGEARARYTAARELYTSLGPEGAENLAFVESRLGTLALRAQELDAAERHLRASTPVLPSRIDEIDAANELANLEARRGDGESSREHALQGVGLARELVATDPLDAVARKKLAWSLDVLGAAQSMLHEREAALASFAESAELYDRNSALDPDDLEARTLAAEMRAKEAGALLGVGRLDEAAELAAASVRELEAVLAADPAVLARERPLCLALDVLAQCRIQRDELAEAAAVLERFLAMARRNADRAPDDAFSQRQMLLVHDRIGVVHERIGADVSRPLAERSAAYARAAEAYGECLATFDVLRERGFLYPGDEGVAPHVEESMLACDGARERLEAEQAERTD